MADQQQPTVVKQLQQRRRTHREHGRVYRTLWIVAGFTVLLGGVALVALPGPAFLVIPVGLAMLSLEFAWAQKLLDSGLSGGSKATRRIKRANRTEKLAGAIALVFAAAAAIAVLVLII